MVKGGEAVKSEVEAEAAIVIKIPADPKKSARTIWARKLDAETTKTSFLETSQVCQ
jgi:secreted protein with Ig-like and vWFA domain